EMLFDTGLGSRGYSVLEQGRIDAVLSANAIDRRRIFEEAAGISRYRQRKHETELRLARVHQDLARLDDVTGELRTRVRSLKIQAGKAERYVAARDEWEGLKTRLVKHQLHSFSGELDGYLKEIDGIESALGEKRTEREALEEAIVTLEAQRGTVVDDLHVVSEDVSRLEGDVRALDERRTQLLARVSSWEHIAGEEAIRVDELSTQLTERSGELTVLEEQKSALQNEVEGVRLEAETHGAERQEWVRVHNEFRKGFEIQNDLLLKALNGRTAAENTVRHLEGAQAPAAERTQRVQIRLQEANEQLKAVVDGEESAELNLGLCEDSFGKSESVVTELRDSLGKASETLEAHEVERNRLDLELTRRTSQIESLLDRDRELADLGVGSKAVLKAIDGPNGPCPKEKMAGLLADHLSIGTEYARALDALLGDRSHALVLTDASSVRGIANWLTERAEGQAGLAIQGGLGERHIPTVLVPAGFEDRVVGPLRAQVRCQDQFARIADVLCANVLLVRDLGTAFEIVGEDSSLRCVTSAGELVDGAGLVAGERTLAQGAIGRRSSAAEMQTEVDELESTRESVVLAIEGAQVARRELAERMRAAESALNEARRAVADARGVLGTAKARASDLRTQSENLQRSYDGVLAEAAKLLEDLAAAGTRFTEFESAYGRESSILSEMEARREGLEVQREELSRAEGQTRIELTRMDQQIEGLSNRIRDLKRGIDSSTSEVARAKRLSDEAGENARTGGEESKQLALNSTKVSEEREVVTARMTDLRKKASEADQDFERARREQDALTRSLEERSTDLSNLRLEEQRVVLARDEVSRRAVEELELELEGLLEGFEPEEVLTEKPAINALDREVRDLKSKIERMGPVNTEALGELEEVGGRLEFLDTQIADLAQSRKVLNETLKKIETESERLFIETFEEVRKNFQRLFRQLFGGGKADVKLAEGEPVLEAGVEISARPPGREMLPIGLLSGGQRTMTALALLFAVFETRPSPFCVLDEVDAALDDANIQRFLMMLEEFRKSTQFIVVTHNKGTMARCETLYGVTMQTKGVSRQVSVQLEEVDEFVPEASGLREPVPANATAKEQSVDSGPTTNRSAEGDVDPESGEPIVEIVPRAQSEEVVDETLEREESSASN
ncbi:MAG: chromosome segregation protein, partial [Planctomycetota bacterium]